MLLLFSFYTLEHWDSEAKEFSCKANNCKVEPQTKSFDYEAYDLSIVSMLTL